MTEENKPFLSEENITALANRAWLDGEIFASQIKPYKLGCSNMMQKANARIAELQEALNDIKANLQRAYNGIEYWKNESKQHDTIKQLRSDKETLRRKINYQGIFIENEAADKSVLQFRITEANTKIAEQEGMIGALARKDFDHLQEKEKLQSQLSQVEKERDELQLKLVQTENEVLLWKSQVKGLPI